MLTFSQSFYLEKFTHFFFFDEQLKFMSASIPPSNISTRHFIDILNLFVITTLFRIVLKSLV